jgi:MoaA/NifB/PqqE/SkfB family radical SAM enzyme
LRGTRFEAHGWHKIRQQRRAIYASVLKALDRAIDCGVLAPRVARVVLRRWTGALLPSRARRAAVDRFRRAHGVPPPWFLVISPGRACNLRCAGCYANAGADVTQATKLPWDVLDRVMSEAKTLWGVPLFVFSGGEPLAYHSQGKDLLDVVTKHRDCLFLMFTNGTLITPQVAERLADLGNLTPALSVEGRREETDLRRGAGTFERVMGAMAHLRHAGVPFGISMTATQQNCLELLAEDNLDFYFDDQGAFYGFVFQYMPIGRRPDLAWVPTPEQRVAFWRQSWRAIRKRELFLLDFWNHGPLVEGCIAAGRDRGYVHVDWDGKVMPCVFMPYAGADLHQVYAEGGTLDDVWSTPFFRAIRQWQRERGYGKRELTREGNWMAPCPFRDHFGMVQRWIAEYEPRPEDGVAPEGALDPRFCSQMVAAGREQSRIGQQIWERDYLGCPRPLSEEGHSERPRGP